MRTIRTKTKSEALSIAGKDWAKIVKGDKEYLFFETLKEYAEWKKQQYYSEQIEKPFSRKV